MTNDGTGVDTLDITRFTTEGPIGGRYRLEQHIASGGMATVFLAQDLRHPRKVAVKILHESLAHTIGIQRFLREIEVIARFQHPHLLTLFDSGDVQGLPYYVMPFVEAQSLRELIAHRGRLSIEEAVRITREVADGLAYAHENGVFHRDIKPSNILMSGGHAVVADFGIATALQRASVGRLTETGISLGSPIYMSPEQASGERDVDARSDVYSVACMLYEMLAGEPPIDSESMQQVVTRKLTDGYTKLRQRRADVPVALEAVIHRALSADREQRQPSMDAFSRDLAAAVPAAVRRVRPAVWIAAALVLLIVGGFWLRHAQRVSRATRQVADINRLTLTGQIEHAFDLAAQVLPIIPRDSALRRLRPMFTDFMQIVTVPPGARVSMQRVDRPDSAWTSVGVTPIDSFAVPKFGSGVEYRVRLELDGYERSELLSSLFIDWRGGGGPAPLSPIHLDSVGTATGMVWIPGGSVVVRGDTLRAADFHIGKTEVTNAQYARFVAAGGYQKREYWAEPMSRGGRAVSWDSAMLTLRDRSGHAGPSTWHDGTFPDGQADFPVGGVSFYEAAAYARWAGLRLPTRYHWERASMRNFRESGWTFMATANIGGREPRTAGKGGANPFGVFDIAGNVREWCVNPMPGGRLTMGGGWEDAAWLVANRLDRPDFDRSPSNGFRLVALVDADTTVARLSDSIRRTVRRDFNNFAAVSEAEFSVYRRMYDYDHPPLGSKIEAEGENASFRWQRVSFSAGYGGERMMAYLFLPKNGTPRFEPILLWPPGTPRTVVPSMPGAMVLIESLLSFIPYSGRALVLPVFKGNPERDSSRYRGVNMDPSGTTEYRDLAVQWVKDMRRTIDYLETRTDMATDRVGFYGVSWGGQIAPLVLAIEPRIKAAVLNSGGYSMGGTPRAEVDPPNYAPRVQTPLLLLSGQHDNAIFPYETSQRPLFQQLGTPLRDKKRVEYALASHFIPHDIVVRETLAWFDNYLRR